MTLTRITIGIALLGLVLLAVAGPGTRLGFWEFGTGFLLMRIAFFVGIAAAIAALALLIVPKTRSAGVVPLAAALVIGIVTAWIPWSGVQKARSLPFIHDITTDTADPPQFVDVVPLRADAPNPHEYQGEEIAEQQRAGYPDIDSVELEIPADAAYEQALATAREMGWDIVAAVPDEGRIEATATTFWFGFKDDVVIRIEDADDGSRLDIRSKSRVGRSDVGTNAARIRRFVDALRS